MTNAIIRAQPPLDFIPERFNPWVRHLTRGILPIWVRWQTDLTNIKVRNAATLAQLYSDFQTGNNRLIMAFRHPATEDAYGMAHLLWQAVPKAAAQSGIALQPVHSHFIYDRGIPLWAGRWVSWLCSRLGGVSIQRGKLDLVALKAARKLLVQGQFPLAAAPEGGNNGHNEIVSPLEPGVPQLAFWCVEDLAKVQRSEPVYIVPLGIQYRYINPPWDAIDQLLSQLETKSGIDNSSEQVIPPVELPTAQITNLYGRLYRLAKHLLALMEGYYQQIYGLERPDPKSDLDANEQLALRLQHLLNGALAVAEKYFNLKPKGSVIDRCRRLEQAGWERIFREDLREEAALSSVERGLADRIAEEADLRMWHMRLVESFVAVTGRYVLEKPTADRFAETVLLLADMVTRIQGKNPFPRPSLGKREALLTVGEPICVSDRKDDYKQSRRKAVATLTKDLQISFENLIVDSSEF
ncbi:phospholipid glycerol acyltransferase [Leptolyngbya sp. Heron Island J]|uniref:phospholipid/glycerol acyltransferase n=1 Tax=Leptolyngbya sp. Heron Island J TaxID=1385935 RepID=UPI0003B973D4|nr:phospholipid/glycerol acyltransferase [Leptolyngbya sp. Heron Island J]ESA35374.1 phospholipid glycerol acyltransferase [Leptolyngbya sp. Heron Island J]